MLRTIALLCLGSVCVSCASFKANTQDGERQSILGWSIGLSAVGALLGATIPDENKGAWAGGAAAIGAAVGAVGATLLTPQHDRGSDTAFLETFLKKDVSKKNQMSALQVLPKDLPKEIKNNLIAPTLKRGKTDWFELDGRIYAPTFWFEYTEGALKIPKLRKR